jgi:hypothetical protein
MAFGGGGPHTSKSPHLRFSNFGRFNIIDVPGLGLSLGTFQGGSGRGARAFLSWMKKVK